MYNIHYTRYMILLDYYIPRGSALIIIIITVRIGISRTRKQSDVERELNNLNRCDKILSAAVSLDT